MAYATKQYQAVLRCLERRAGQSLTAADLLEDLRRNESPVGLATIYRQLEKLEKSGHVHKVTTEEGALYQYCPHAEEGRNCFLLRCEGCGRIVHLDCVHLEELYQHLAAEHHFRINARHTVLTGRCRTCEEKEAQHGIQ